MMAGFDMKDYVDVPERIAAFTAKYPDGSLQSELEPLVVDGVGIVGWKCRAYAYRSPSDERPGIGHAVEPVPGKTPYTRDSEAMNAETSAWGRAIVALGFPTKKIASREEVEARQGSAAGTAEPAKRGKAKEAPSVSSSPAADIHLSEQQRKRLFELAKENEVSNDRLREILEATTGQQLTAEIPVEKYDAVIDAITLEGVPFE